MTERLIARFSLFVAVSMIVGLFGVWTAVGKPAQPPLVTVGVALGHVRPGGAVYGVQVRNQGAGEARAVRVDAHFPEGLRVERALPGAHCRAARCTWSLGDVGPGEVHALLIRTAFERTRPLRARVRAVAVSANSPTSTHLARPLLVTRSGGATAAALAARCIDVDPESGTGPSDAEIRYDALVTDGAKATMGLEDGCSGAPVADAQVAWVIEDDDPDAWISSQDGVPTTKIDQGDDAQPDEVTTQSKADGTTFIRIRLDNPVSGEGRYSAHVGEDVPEPDSHILCDVPIIGHPCPGESSNEDDVRFSWGPPSDTPSPTAGSPSPQPTNTTPPKTARQVTLDPSRAKVRSGRQVVFAGRVTSSSQTCRAEQFVRLRRRIVGEQSFSEFASTTTGPSGSFSVGAQIDRNAEYVAVAGETEACAEAASTPETVLARASVATSVIPAQPVRGRRFKVAGFVFPNKSGTKVLLQRKKGGRFRTIERDELRDDSDYAFRLRARFDKRLFRVLWKKQDETNEAGARKVRVRTRD